MKIVKLNDCHQVGGLWRCLKSSLPSLIISQLALFDCFLNNISIKFTRSIADLSFTVFNAIELFLWMLVEWFSSLEFYRAVCEILQLWSLHAFLFAIDCHQCNSWKLAREIDERARSLLFRNIYKKSLE